MEEGGSLTLIATLMTGTDARIDEIVAEDMVGTANAEIVLSRDLADGGLFPALDLRRSWSSHSRRLAAAEADRLSALRRCLPEDPVAAALRAQDWMRRYSSNASLLDACAQGLLDSAV